MNVIDPDAFLKRLEGAGIDHCEITEDGMHIVLEDGRILILTGAFVVGLFRPEEGSLH
jgi:hypothetical protein